MSATIIACALMAAGPSLAQSYDEAPVISAQRVADGGRARASMDIQAPPHVVWAILSDCQNARRYIRELISCRIIDRGTGWDVREHRLRGWPLKRELSSVSRVTFEPDRRMAFSRVGGDWTRSDGEWRLAPIDGGRGTHLEYDLDAAIRSPLPASWTQAFIVDRMRASLSALRREAEREAASAAD